MRTTLTIDDDLLERLRVLAARERASFRDTVNAVIRRGLTTQELRSRRRPKFKVQPFDSAFHPGVDPQRLNQLVDELEVDRAVAKIRRGG